MSRKKKKDQSYAILVVTISYSLRTNNEHLIGLGPGFVSFRKSPNNGVLFCTMR